jgi:hypothetical protein
MEEGRFHQQYLKKNAKSDEEWRNLLYFIRRTNQEQWKMRLENVIFHMNLWRIIFYQEKKLKTFYIVSYQSKMKKLIRVMSIQHGIGSTTIEKNLLLLLKITNIP